MIDLIHASEKMMKKTCVDVFTLMLMYICRGHPSPHIQKMYMYSNLVHTCIVMSFIQTKHLKCSYERKYTNLISFNHIDILNHRKLPWSRTTKTVQKCHTGVKFGHGLHVSFSQH